MFFSIVYALFVFEAHYLNIVCTPTSFRTSAFDPHKCRLCPNSLRPSRLSPHKCRLYPHDDASTRLIVHTRYDPVTVYPRDNTHPVTLCPHSFEPKYSSCQQKRDLLFSFKLTMSTFLEAFYFILIVIYM